METLTSDRAARLALLDALVDVLPVGVPALGVALAITGWCEYAQIPADRVDQLAQQLARHAPLD